MALFKPYNGDESLLINIPFHDGYVYFTTDQAHMFFDTYVEEEGKEELQEKRIQLNAKGADVLFTKDQDGKVTEVSVDNLVLRSAVIDVEHGGTGQTSLEKGKILIGNETDGIEVLTGTGSVYLIAGVPVVGTLPLEDGGTGATSAAEARDKDHLDVYNRSETEKQIDTVTSKAYPVTLSIAGWSESGEWYAYSWKEETLTCGKTGDLPPICQCVSGLDDYSKIDHAEVQAGYGITFYTKTMPTQDIQITVIDIK